MRLAIVALALGLLAAGKGRAKAKEERCPFVGVADLDKDGQVASFAGADLPPAGQVVWAFDSDGKVGRLRVGHTGADLTMLDKLPARIRDAAFSHVMLVDRALEQARVAQPGDDLPSGVYASAVQLLLADKSGVRAVLLSIPTENEDETCDEIDCKVGGAWRACWSDCK